nr:immunoglobulin heavy chain junction region [Macaca mulatta]
CVRHEYGNGLDSW